jgi:hypothetical protein
MRMRKLFLEIAFFLVLALVLALLFNVLSPNRIKLILPKIFSEQPATHNLYCGPDGPSLRSFTLERQLSR